MSTDLIATGLVLRILRRHLDRAAVSLDPEMMRRFHVGKTHPFVTALVHACRVVRFHRAIRHVVVI
jgi:hypothetical protein